MENATFWENMQTLEQSIEGNYNSFVSAASKFNNNFTYRYPGWNHVESPAEIPEEFPGQCPVGGHVKCPTVQCYYHCPRNQKAGSKSNNNNFGQWHLGQSHAEILVEIPGRHHVEHHVQHPTVSRNHHCSRKEREPNNNNNRPREYEHHFAFMATTVGPNPDILGDDDGTYHAPGKPMETPASAVKYTGTKMEFEMYEEAKMLAKIITKVGNFLQGQHPELLCTMEKMSLFDGTVDGSDPGSEEGSPSAFCNLDNALNSERERKPAAQREDQREGKSERTDYY